MPTSLQSAPRQNDGRHDASPAIDEEVITDLIEFIGQEMVEKLADQLVQDLSQRFDLPTDRAGLRREAHMTVSMAGALGLARLQDAARTLEYAEDATCDWAGTLGLCLRARDEAIEILRSRFLGSSDRTAETLRRPPAVRRRAN